MHSIQIALLVGGLFEATALYRQTGSKGNHELSSDTEAQAQAPTAHDGMLLLEEIRV